ncbi:sulfur carrier protein ThiS [uncultured Muribaculum sp.]|uniref:sulfur carrier protein ThiS n=1 Tax=uncultured Muribaculum sp. TaxID=1918613 RepID=UPI0025E60545|nr:sulfur carrier protein ThiS [uncultured Muribaculum sp.]
MEVTVNDKKITVPDNTSLQGALNLAGINPEGVATALNGEVVPLTQRDSTILKNGDAVLVIQPFYGG